MKSGKNYYIEFNRILFTLFIVLGHSEHLFSTDAPRKYFSGAGIGVDFFFIVAGFFLMKSLAKQSLTTKDYFWSRLKRLYPHYIISTLLMLLIIIKNGAPLQEITQTIFQEIFMLQFITPTRYDVNGPMWYVATLLAVSSILFWAARRKGSKVRTVLSVIYIIGFYIFAFIALGTMDTSRSETIKMFFVPIYFYVAFADIMLGMYCYRISQKISKPLSKLNLLWVIPLTALGYSLVVIFPHCRCDFIFLAIIPICLIATSKMEFGNCVALDKISHYLYPIFCYQMCGSRVMKIVLSRFPAVEGLNSIVKALILVTICVGIGVVFDILVERFIFKNKKRIR